MGLAPTIRFSYLHTWVAVSKIKVWRVNPLRSNELNQVLLFLFFLKFPGLEKKTGIFWPNIIFITLPTEPQRLPSFCFRQCWKISPDKVSYENLAVLPFFSWKKMRQLCTSFSRKNKRLVRHTFSKVGLFLVFATESYKTAKP
jgi:hypothetical protein